jgi:hypothetical protein
MRWIVLSGLLLASAHANPYAAEPLQFNLEKNKLSIEVDGKSIATYVWNDPNIPRPYFRQIITLDGYQVTRRYPTDPVLNKGNDDHATYHPGMWLAFGDLGGADFWRNKAEVLHTSFLNEPTVEDRIGKFSVVNLYKTDSRNIAKEICHYTIRVLKHGFLLTSNSVFEPIEESIMFGDQEEMGLGIRVATALTVRHGSGQLLNSDGGANEKGTWGKASQWCAYSGELEESHVGVLLMPSPRNFRKSWFHSRDYGLLVANPFGRKAMTGPDDPGVAAETTTLSSETPFELAFGIYFFDTPITQDIDFNKMYTEYLETLNR